MISIGDLVGLFRRVLGQEHQLEYVEGEVIGFVNDKTVEIISENQAVTAPIMSVTKLYDQKK